MISTICGKSSSCLMIVQLLRSLQSVISELNVADFRSIVFCFRFGEKMTNGLSLSEFNQDIFEKVTVHAAVDIASNITGIDLFWSMSGLQEVVGNRGSLGTCLSFTDCGNFQSNLDGRALDIKPALRQICRYPSQLKCVQVYADLPHRKPTSRFHPVSGMIIGGMCFARPTVDAFRRDAASFLSTLESNWSLMRKSSCRFEMVTELNVTGNIVHATDCIDVSKLVSLLQEKPLLVPVPSETLASVRELGLWITKEMHEALSNFQRTGNVHATWHSYQMELASEKLLWGHLLLPRSSGYSVNLGPGLLSPSRSLTDHLGFLALEASTSCMHYEDCIPAYCIWTQSEIV